MRLRFHASAGIESAEVTSIKPARWCRDQTRDLDHSALAS
jgi:hypothetical protein